MNIINESIDIEYWCQLFYYCVNICLYVNAEMNYHGRGGDIHVVQNTHQQTMYVTLHSPLIHYINV